MGVQIIEQFICSKYPDQKKCEDGLFISNDFIAVIDGVTSKGELTWPDGSEGGSVFLSPMTSGRYAREILAQALKTMEPGIDAASAMEYLNQALAKAGSGRREFLRDHPEERLQAVVILYSCEKREVWAFGDCQCLIGDTLHSHGKEIDGLVAEIRCLYNQAELILGGSEDDFARAGPASFLCCAANSFWPTRTGPMAMMYLTVLPFTLTMCPSIRSRPKPRSYWPATVTPY